ncbi:hypothetical protein IWQ48_004720 [Labrenzia sp. EL_13]|nr:hypothetical protein [Labrenzia sp. EL_13]
MKTKVFCVGFQKTGTTSMETALGILGYRVTSIFGKTTPVETLRSTYVEEGLKIANEYDAVQDMPWPLLFRELDEAFPGSKFILTLRDEDSWWASVLGHFGNNPAILQQLTYGDDAGAPFGNEDHYRSVYRNHNQAVLDYFKDKPDDLLVMNFSKPVDWENLCSFLRCDVPDQPFPTSNQPKQSPGIRRSLRRMYIRNLNYLFNKLSR